MNKTIELNEQQVEFLISYLEQDLTLGATAIAIKNQIINKLEAE